jgi:hypothetical protein
MSTLERAIAITAEAHAGHFDKAGAPYVLHPLRMMLRVSSIDERIVAVLHDVVEDCQGWTFDRLRSEGFSDHIIEALQSVTKCDGEGYEVGLRAGIRSASNNCCRRRGRRRGKSAGEMRDQVATHRSREASGGDLDELQQETRQIGRVVRYGHTAIPRTRGTTQTRRMRRIECKKNDDTNGGITARSAAAVH